MPTIDWSTSPIALYRASLATILKAGTSVEVESVWTANPKPPVILLDGGGWTPATGCGVTYTIVATCLYAHRGGIGIDEAEELARRVYATLMLTNGVPPVIAALPPGKVTIDGVDYGGAQLRIAAPLDLGEVES